MRALAALVTFVGLVACAGRSSKLPSGSATMGDEITLYREHAIVTRRIDVVVPEASKATVTFLVPAGVGLEDVAVIERGTLVVSEPRGPSTPEPPPPAIVREDSEADPFDGMERGVLIKTSEKERNGKNDDGSRL